MNIHPLGSFVFIKKTKEKKNPNPVYIPEDADKYQAFGIVWAVAAGKPEEQMPVKGDTVIYNPKGAFEITVENEVFYAMQLTNIIAILEK